MIGGAIGPWATALLARQMIWSRPGRTSAVKTQFDALRYAAADALPATNVRNELPTCRV
jgi:hypothetical protein